MLNSCCVPRAKVIEVKHSCSQQAPGVLGEGSHGIAGHHALRSRVPQAGRLPVSGNASLSKGSSGVFDKLAKDSYAHQS